MSDLAGLILPGFEIDAENPSGPTTFFGVRNTTDQASDITIDYFGRIADDMPLRTDPFQLQGQETITTNIRANLASLEQDDGVVSGLAIFNDGTDDAEGLEGDYFRVDIANAFASGERLVRPEDFCNNQELRFVDFGAGASLQILVNRPRGMDQPSFTYVAYSESGAKVAEGEHFTTDHLLFLDVADLVPGTNFGSLVFDFTASRGGWVSGRYSAFGQFSLELNSACKD